MTITISQEYEYKALRILSAVWERNPHNKDQVGAVIFDYVDKIAGEERALKISGMLLDLPIPQIQMFLTSYTNKLMRV